MSRSAFNTPQYRELKFETVQAPVVRGKGVVEYDLFQAHRPSGMLVVLWHGWLGHKTLRHVAQDVSNDGSNVVLIGKRQDEAHSMIKDAVLRTGETDVVVLDHSDGHRQLSEMIAHQKTRPDEDLTYRIRNVLATASIGTNGRGVNIFGMHREISENAKLLRNHPREEVRVITQSVQNYFSDPVRASIDAMRAIRYKSDLTAGIHNGVTVTETYFDHDFVVEPPTDTTKVAILPGSHLTAVIDPDVARDAIKLAFKNTL